MAQCIIPIDLHCIICYINILYIYYIVYENANTDRGVSVQMTDNSLKSATYYEPMSLDMDPSHLHHQPHPFNTTHLNTSATGDHISMQEEACPRLPTHCGHAHLRRIHLHLMVALYYTSVYNQYKISVCVAAYNMS